MPDQARHSAKVLYMINYSTTVCLSLACSILHLYVPVLEGEGT